MQFKLLQPNSSNLHSISSSQFHTQIYFFHGKLFFALHTRKCWASRRNCKHVSKLVVETANILHWNKLLFLFWSHLNILHWLERKWETEWFTYMLIASRNIKTSERNFKQMCYQNIWAILRKNSMWSQSCPEMMCVFLSHPVCTVKADVYKWHINNQKNFNNFLRDFSMVNPMKHNFSMGEQIYKILATVNTQSDQQCEHGHL